MCLYSSFVHTKRPYVREIWQLELFGSWITSSCPRRGSTSAPIGQIVEGVVSSTSIDVELEEVGAVLEVLGGEDVRHVELGIES